MNKKLNKEAKKIPIIAIVGPTAAGKTQLAIRLAQKFNGEIVSADSMQIYKEFNVCTAKPTTEEQKLVRHHCINIVSVTEEFSVARFVELAQKCIFDVHEGRKIPIVCGGTGLYVDSLLKNVKFEKYSFNPEIRKKLITISQSYEGKNTLYKMLKHIDTIAANSIHVNNTKRIIRALEFYFSTGKTISTQVENSKSIPSLYECTKIGINNKNRNDLYKKINERVDNMLKNDIVSEVKKTQNLNPSKTASVAIGYKEFLPYLSGLCDIGCCIETLKKNTRNYAKRQLSWFRRDKSIFWIELGNNSLEEFENASKIACDHLEHIINIPPLNSKGKYQ